MAAVPARPLRRHLVKDAPSGGTRWVQMAHTAPLTRQVLQLVQDALLPRHLRTELVHIAPEARKPGTHLAQDAPLSCFAL